MISARFPARFFATYNLSRQWEFGAVNRREAIANTYLKLDVLDFYEGFYFLKYPAPLAVCSKLSKPYVNHHMPGQRRLRDLGGFWLDLGPQRELWGPPVLGNITNHP